MSTDPLETSDGCRVCPDPDPGPQLALVLPGGGARAAYQAGVLRGLGREFPKLRFSFITGVSAGAINATFLAAHPGNLEAAATDLAALWEEIEFDDIFRVDTLSLARNALKWLVRLVLGGSKLGPEVHGLLDTQPLRRLMERELQAHDGRIEGIGRNIEAGRLRALALLTVNYGTGQTVIWTDGCDVEAWQRPNRRAVSTQLTVDHVMASSALPLVFPAIELDGGWFGDGGIRLAAPFSPALHLGADRILAISIRYPRSREEADQTSLVGYPPPAQIAGNLMNAIFLDVLDQDVLRLERLNRVLEKLPPEEREGLKPVDVEVLRPSQDLGKLSAGFENKLPRGLRFLTRGLGTRETKSPDYLSLLMFHSGYLRLLVELGEEDVAARKDELAEWIGG
ncbi:MAG: patatin-like phospholipase family protein [Thermoanaerobaculia bacterium]